MVNKTEQKAIEWLKEKGYSYEQIKINGNSTPDFICNDGKRYEVKLLYGNKIIFYSNQTEKMLDDDIVLVFNKSGFVEEFKWNERENSSIKITSVKDDTTMIRIQKSTAKRIKKLKLCSLDPYDEILDRLLKRLKNDK